MSTKEQILSILDNVPEYKLRFLLAYIQGLTAEESEEFNETTLQAIEEKKHGEYETFSADVSTADAFASVLGA